MPTATLAIATAIVMATATLAGSLWSGSPVRFAGPFRLSGSPDRLASSVRKSGSVRRFACRFARFCFTPSGICKALRRFEFKFGTSLPVREPPRLWKYRFNSFWFSPVRRIYRFRQIPFYACSPAYRFSPIPFHSGPNQTNSATVRFSPVHANTGSAMRQFAWGAEL